jgi:hypothetical protein
MIDLVPDLVTVKDEEGYELLSNPDGTPFGWISPIRAFDKSDLEELERGPHELEV